MCKHSLFASALLCASLQAQTLDVINVESSSISERFSKKKHEVSSIARISGKQVNESHAENIIQLLSGVAGVTAELQGGDSLKLHLRGVANEAFMGEKPGVAVVIDGVPVFERTGRVNIDLDNIEDIKVIKGGASYLFGNDALGGAVIISTKKGAKNGSEIASEFGSYGYSKLIARTGVSKENYNFNLQTSQKKMSRGYWANSDYLIRYINAKYQHYLSDSSDLTLGLEYASREKDSHGTVKGVKTAKTDPTSTASSEVDYASNYDINLYKFFLTYAKDFDDNTNLLVNLYQYYDHTYYLSGYVDYDINHNAVERTQDNKPNKNNYAQLQRGLKSELRSSKEKYAWMAGLDLRANKYDNVVNNAVSYSTKRGPTFTDYTAGDETKRNKTHENVYAAYGEYKYAFNPKFSTTTNLRIDSINLSYTDANNPKLDKDFLVYSGRVGTNYALKPTLNLYSNISTGFRTPTIEQLFAGKTSPSGDTDSNENLKPEHSYNYELGLRGKAKNTLFDLSAFWLERKNYILETAGLYGSSSTNKRYENIGGARHLGLEVSTKTTLTPRLSLQSAYTYLRATFSQYDNYGLSLGNPYNGSGSVEKYNLTGNDIPRVSRHHLNVKSVFQATKKADFALEMDAKSSYFADELNRHKMPGVVLFHFLAHYKTKLFGYESTFFTRVDNLFDTFYYNTARGYRDSDYDGDYDSDDLSLVVNQGRVYTAGLSIKF